MDTRKKGGELHPGRRRAAAALAAMGAIGFIVCAESCSPQTYDPPTRTTRERAVSLPTGDELLCPNDDAAVDDECVACSDDNVSAVVDRYLVWAASQPPTPVVSAQPSTFVAAAPDPAADASPCNDDPALTLCFGISNYIQWVEGTFDCKHFAYYTRECLKRKGLSAGQVSVFCKNCSNPKYPGGVVGHEIVAYASCGQCCLRESESPYPGSQNVCAPSVNGVCPWDDLMKRANDMYCSGQWFGDPERKTDCVDKSVSWNGGTFTCSAASYCLLADAGIAPPDPCKGLGRAACLAANCAWWGDPSSERGECKPK